MPVNQVSASYLEPPRYVEACLCGSHVPSMLISRFELLKELESTPSPPPSVIPFTMSTVTALAIAERRITRSMVLNRIDKELKKFHGSFIKSNVKLTSIHMEAQQIRPVFLPLFKFAVSTAATSDKTSIAAYVCGATGKVVGPVLHTSAARRLGLSAAAAAGTMVGLAPFLVEPGTAVAAAVAAAVATPMAQRATRRAKFLRERARHYAELQTISMLNLGSDAAGYRWTPHDEEKDEYEYREELRRQARRKAAFEQQVKEEAARDWARQQGPSVDARNRRRTDLVNADPLGYYEILGLKGRELSVPVNEISKAFREAVRIHHPDVNREENSDDKKRHLQNIIEAYRVLRDPKTKKMYDCGELKKD